MAMIDESKIDIPPALTGSAHPAIEYMRITKNCNQPFSERLVHEIRHTYFAMIAALDEMVGRVLQALGDLGLDESTYVIFSSDHGEMAGEQSQILKRSMYEPSTHVPLIVRGPDVTRGATVNTPVSLVDLYPTLLNMSRTHYGDCANRPGYPDALDGESLMPQLTGGSDRARDWAFSEYHGDRCCTGTFMLRRGQWKYVRHVGYGPELFDLEKDPWEMANLADERPDVVAELDGILKDIFDCEGIDARAKHYDKQSFRRWRNAAKAAGAYEDTMARVYSGFDRLCIEDIVPWARADEATIEAWLKA